MAEEMDAVEGFSRAVEQLRLAFPNLQIRSTIDPDEPNIQATASIPPQPGLEQGIGFDLIGDELHFDIGNTNLALEWFPSTDSVVVDEFVQAIAGFIAGQNRVVETFIGEHLVKAELQAPTGAAWRTLATWWSVAALIPWPRHRTITLNSAADGFRRAGA